MTYLYLYLYFIDKGPSVEVDIPQEAVSQVQKSSSPRLTFIIYKSSNLFEVRNRLYDSVTNYTLCLNTNVYPYCV